MQVDVSEREVGQPFAIDARGPVFDAARWAFGEADGHELVEIGIGGSIPFVAAFATAFPVAAILATSAGPTTSAARTPPTRT